MQHICQIVNYIENNLFEPISLDEISKSIGYSKYHMCKLFRSKTGLTINQYIIDRRLTEAVKLLNSSNDSLLNIAIECGFSNDKYFSKLFKSRFGIPPIKYKYSCNYISLTKKLYIGEGKMIKYKNDQELINNLIECKNINEVKTVISNSDECILVKHDGSLLSLLYILHDEKDRGIEIKHLRLNLINGVNTVYSIYRLGNINDVTMKNLEIVKEDIVFNFVDLNTKSKSKARLVEYDDDILQIKTTMEEI